MVKSVDTKESDEQIIRSLLYKYRWRLLLMWVVYTTISTTVAYLMREFL